MHPVYMCASIEFKMLLGPGPRDDVTALALLRISAVGLKFGGMMHVRMKQIAS